MFLGLFSVGAFAKEQGPVTCSITRIEDETSATTVHNVPLTGRPTSDARYELRLDGFRFRATAAVRELSNIHLTVWMNDDFSSSVDGVRGLTMLTFTGKVGAGAGTVVHYDFRCK